MTNKNSIIPLEEIQSRILILRGQRVMIDSDLAELYGVTTKRLNEQVRRNQSRFPRGFMFHLTTAEKAKVVAICDHLVRLKFSTVLPNAFTEHGAIMAASVLNTPRAIEVSVFVVRAFVRLREMLASHKDLARKLVALEQKYDVQFRVFFDAIWQLMRPPQPGRRRRIGFHVEN
jgi:hypothetical protein